MKKKQANHERPTRPSLHASLSLYLVYFVLHVCVGKLLISHDESATETTLSSPSLCSVVDRGQSKKKANGHHGRGWVEKY